MLIAFVKIAPRGICLPNFDESFRHRTAVFIDHAPADDNSLADGLGAECCLVKSQAFTFTTSIPKEGPVTSESV